MSSLIGQLPLAAVWLYCKDVNQTQKFYRDVVGLKPIQDGVGKDEDAGPHFDLGTVRLSLLPKNAGASGSTKGNGGGEKSPLAQQQQQLVFVVENSIEAVFRDLSKRGVKMTSKKIVEDETGKTAWFNDPDGHTIYLWQPPKRNSAEFKQVETLVKHYESVSRALADLRVYDEEAEEDR
jgi:catechol 2,3-dioxygenase-like lactoylglutathione lyase family enzyme